MVALRLPGRFVCCDFASARIGIGESCVPTIQKSVGSPIAITAFESVGHMMEIMFLVSQVKMDFEMYD
jgi:hypothetical protein